ncbi:MAG: transcription elongation factor GreA [Propionibacteriaceae bacterium]|nr:transcription elongation factor GreA [Propionibacteriaceae bacterium]
MTEPPSGEWLTRRGYDKLRQEYEHLSDVKLAEIAKRIGQARDEGDLSENAGYHAAREEQGRLMARIAELKQKLDRAVIGVVKVQVAYFGDPEDTDTFLLGSREMLAMDDSIELPVYSPQSPLGAAVAGHEVGDEVSYEAPNGKRITVTIMDIGPYDV